MTGSPAPPGGVRGFCVQEEDEGERLDRFVPRALEDLSRSRAQGLIAEGLVLVNDAVKRPGYRLRIGDRVSVQVPEPVQLVARPEDLPLTVVHEDADLLVVDKPAGMAVHPAPGSPSGTLVNALLHHCRDLSGINGVLRPGIVHRLDRGTTGLLMVAKNDAAHRGLAAQLEERSVERRYTALVWGSPPGAGVVDAPLDRSPADRKRIAVVEGGRRAVTRFRRLRELGFLSLLELRLETGRTHQIRVHLQHLGHPVFGDRPAAGRLPVYGTGEAAREPPGWPDPGIDPRHRPAAASRLLEGGPNRVSARRCTPRVRSLGFFRFDRVPPAHRGGVLRFESPLPEDMARTLTHSPSSRTAYLSGKLKGPLTEKSWPLHYAQIRRPDLGCVA